MRREELSGEQPIFGSAIRFNGDSIKALVRWFWMKGCGMHSTVYCIAEIPLVYNKSDKCDKARCHPNLDRCK